MPVILGIDEVGRGPWAGPLVVGAVILGENFNTDDRRHYLYSHLADSKALTAKQRTELAPLITQFATASATGWVSSTELDRYGLSASLKLATRRAVKQILAQKIPFDEIIIDGTVNFLANTPLADRVTTLKKADALIKEVSAAAILAKVARDDYMSQLATQYPAYGFEKHVGYGTQAHLAALEEHGICPEHRTSFRPIQKILNQHPGSGHASSGRTAHATSTTARGQKAELAVARYLEQRGHHIIAHNFKTKTCEIDLISTLEDQIYFTEVKYSTDPRPEGTPLVRITPEKQRKMAYATEIFLKNRDFAQFSPILAVASVTGVDFIVQDWFTI